MKCGSCLLLGTGMILEISRNSTATPCIYSGLMCGVCKNPTTEDFECDKSKDEIIETIKKEVEK
jgi:hypothetical protein